MWVDSLFKAIGEALGLYKQTTDPEIVRLTKLANVETDLEKERIKLDELLASAKPVDSDLGACLNRIVELRRKKDGLVKR